MFCCIASASFVWFDYISFYIIFFWKQSGSFLLAEDMNLSYFLAPCIFESSCVLSHFSQLLHFKVVNMYRQLKTEHCPKKNCMNFWDTFSIFGIICVLLIFFFNLWASVKIGECELVLIYCNQSKLRKRKLVHKTPISCRFQLISNTSNLMLFKTFFGQRLAVEIAAEDLRFHLKW